MDLVCVVIPVYKESPTDVELESFLQVLNVLNEHPICLVAPTGLNLSKYLNTSSNDQRVKVARFPHDYFEDINGYNQLMLSGKFYYRFLKFKYILIYQLDCWVFKDELADWCKKQYSYIGAPWNAENILIQKQLALTFRPKNNYKQRIFKLFQRHPLNQTVGNGGFSLRRTSHFLLATWLLKIVIRRWGINEDFFWGLYAGNLLPFFRVPSTTEARFFSIEENPDQFIQSKEDLPFGCHAWEKYNKAFWSQFISIE